MSLIAKRGNGASLLQQLRARIALDRHALDLAAEEQPQLFLDVANEHVMAQSRHDAARDELLRIDAELGRKVRADMEASGTKPTEGKIADNVLGEQRHVDAANKTAAAKVEVDEWLALRSSLEHRKSMIRELATLYASGYYTAGASSGAKVAVRDKDAAANRERLSVDRAQRK